MQINYNNNANVVTKTVMIMQRTVAEMQIHSTDNANKLQ